MSIKTTTSALRASNLLAGFASSGTGASNQNIKIISSELFKGISKNASESNELLIELLICMAVILIEFNFEGNELKKIISELLQDIQEGSFDDLFVEKSKISSIASSLAKIVMEKKNTETIHDSLVNSIKSQFYNVDPGNNTQNAMKSDSYTRQRQFPNAARKEKTARLIIDFVVSGIDISEKTIDFIACELFNVSRVENLHTSDTSFVQMATIAAAKVLKLGGDNNSMVYSILSVFEFIGTKKYAKLKMNQKQLDKLVESIAQASINHSGDALELVESESIVLSMTASKITHEFNCIQAQKESSKKDVKDTLLNYEKYMTIDRVAGLIAVAVQSNPKISEHSVDIMTRQLLDEKTNFLHARFFVEIAILAAAKVRKLGCDRMTIIACISPILESVYSDIPEDMELDKEMIANDAANNALNLFHSTGVELIRTMSSSSVNTKLVIELENERRENERQRLEESKLSTTEDQEMPIVAEEMIVEEDSKMREGVNEVEEEKKEEGPVPKTSLDPITLEAQICEDDAVPQAATADNNETLNEVCGTEEKDLKSIRSSVFESLTQDGERKNEKLQKELDEISVVTKNKVSDVVVDIVFSGTEEITEEDIELVTKELLRISENDINHIRTFARVALMAAEKVRKEGGDKETVLLAISPVFEYIDLEVYRNVNMDKNQIKIMAESTARMALTLVHEKPSDDQVKETDMNSHYSTDSPCSVIDIINRDKEVPVDEEPEKEFNIRRRRIEVARAITEATLSGEEVNETVVYEMTMRLAISKKKNLSHVKSFVEVAMRAGAKVKDMGGNKLTIYGACRSLLEYVHEPDYDKMKLKNNQIERMAQSTANSCMVVLHAKTPPETSLQEEQNTKYANSALDSTTKEDLSTSYTAGSRTATLTTLNTSQNEDEKLTRKGRLLAEVAHITPIVVNLVINEEKMTDEMVEYVYEKFLDRKKKKSKKFERKDLDRLIMDYALRSAYYTKLFGGGISAISAAAASVLVCRRLKKCKSLDLRPHEVRRLAKETALRILDDAGDSEILEVEGIEVTPN